MLNSLVKEGETAPAGMIDEIIGMMMEHPEPMVNALQDVQQVSDMIRIQMLTELDWRKRASMAAMLISRSLD